MSQGFQQIRDHMTTRNDSFLKKAEALTPELHCSDIYPVSEVSMCKDTSSAHGWRADKRRTIKQLEETVFVSGDEFILDLGVHCVGYLEFSCEVIGSPQDAPVHLQFIFGETTAEVAESFSSYDGWLSSSWFQQEDQYYDVLPPAVSLARRYCCRYIKVRIVATSRKFGISIKDVKFQSITSAGGPCAVKHFADPLLNKINAISISTLKNCMQSVFEDGPKRDRRLWLGDLRLQALVNYATFQQNDLVKRCLYLFAGVTRNDGMVSANLFMQPTVQADDTYLTDYSLFFVATLADYFAETGDIACVQELWPTAMRQIELAIARLDENYLLKDSSEWWAFIDWNDQLNKQAATQGVLIYCIHKALKLAEVIDMDKMAYLLDLEAKLKQMTLIHLWDSDRGFFVSGASAQISWASQVWLILADVGDREFQIALLERLHSNPPQIRMQTPYMMHHYVDALLMCGLRSQAGGVIRGYWGAMAELGADTFWEVFDPSQPDLSPYGSPLINSYCHAWSCTPAWLLLK